MNNRKVVKASLAYKRVPAPMLASYLGWIITCLTVNLAFPKPPVPIVPPGAA